ncbi:MAG: tetratricopeptide repeat protein [Halobacteriovoraceae bacterium]|nr:tetratricopeptide repeat protein [Halobacteriovoraceae bacterium]
MANEKVKEIISIIDEELAEVTRLNKNSKGTSPNFMLRMAELLLEKARFLKEMELDKYLAIPAKERYKHKRSEYFFESRKYFVQAQKTSLLMLKKFKNFKRKSDVYYILAYNAKEFNDLKKSIQYFDQAINLSQNDSTINYKSKLALAELYYNQRKYQKAVPLYESALRKKLEKWWTKDAYNLAWTYMRLKKYDMALRMMLEVDNYSSRKEFVDMRKNTQKDLGYFYIQAGKLDQGIKYFEDTNTNTIDGLVNISKILFDNGKFESAAKVLIRAKKYTHTEEDEVKVYFSLLNVYDKSGDIDNHYDVSAVLVSKKLNFLNETQKETLVYQIKRKAASAQKQSVSKFMKGNPKLRAKRAYEAAKYYDLLGVISPKDSTESYFLAAEAMYANSEVDKAMNYYDRSLELSEKSGDKKFKELALKGMLATMGLPNVTKKQKDSYLEKVFTLTIANSGKNKKINKIYQRLFSFYLERKNYPKAEETIYNFSKEFPSDTKTIEIMIGNIVDAYRKNGQKKEVVAWVKNIRIKNIKVSKGYYKKLREIAAIIQLQDIEKNNDNGLKKEALKAYIDIYKSPDSNWDAKVNSAYNIATLFYELGHGKKLYQWTKRSLEIKNSKKVLKFLSSYILIASDLFNRRLFAESAEIYNMTYSKICSLKTNKSDQLFNETVLTLLLNKQFEKAQMIALDGSSCGVKSSLIRDAKYNILDYYADKKDWQRYRDWLETVENERVLRGRIISSLYEYMTYLKTKVRFEESKIIENKIFNYYSETLKNNYEITAQSTDVVSLLKIEELKKMENEIWEIQLKFPFNLFVKQFTKRFQKLNKFVNFADNILKIPSGDGSVKVYRIMVETYTRYVDELLKFSPEGIDPQDLNDLRANLKRDHIPLINKIPVLINEAKSYIKKNQVLSSDNYWFFSEKRFPVNIEYHYPRSGIVMDRGGKK